MSSLGMRDFIEKVREKINIVDVIGRRIPLDRHNRALCPFHEETTPSFSVNPGGQYFHCFGCGTGGDVFRFFELLEGKPFMQVLSELGLEVGLSLPALSPQDIQHAEDERMISEILRYTAWFYHQTLTDAAREYLNKERGITDQTISNFWIGYANEGLHKYLVDDCNFPLDHCIKAGVLKKSPTGTVRDYFYGRIIFPNFRRGYVVHLSGRSFENKEPKYLHLPGEMHYLYNEDALSSREVHVAEGVFDCLSAVQAGYPAVAVYGTGSFKPEYLSKFSRCENVYLCLDADDAGREAAIRIGGLIGEGARVVQLPEGFDLNDYFKEHSEEDFGSLVATAMDVIKFEISFIPPDFPKTELPRRLMPVLEKLARMGKARREAYLNYDIKEHFRSKGPDIDGYREIINGLRRQSVVARKSQTSPTEGEAIYTAHFDGLVDLVEFNGNPAFLIKEQDRLLIADRVEREGFVYIPPPKEQIPWLLPRGDAVMQCHEQREKFGDTESNAALYDDLLAYHKGISELPGQEYYGLLGAWVLHTYLLEGVEYSPVICLYAVPERGKSRTGKAMVNAAYRGLHVESLREAYIIRMATNFHVTIFFDVMDIWGKAERSGSEDVLLQRFERGATVPRVLYPDRGPFRDTVYFSIFGPTVIATNEGVHEILATRSVTIKMPEATRTFENDVTRELALPLRERLTAFRARYMGEALPDLLKCSWGRLGDILKPLQQVIRLVRPERESSFLTFVNQLENERFIERGETLEAEILIAVLSLQSQVSHGALSVKEITEALNQSRSERSKVSDRRVGRKLSALGFDKARTNSGASAIIWDDYKISRLTWRYGV